MSNRRYFQRGSGVFRCEHCGKRTRNTSDVANNRLCARCFEYLEQMNAHSDKHSGGRSDDECPFCNNENCTVEEYFVAKSTGLN